MRARLAATLAMSGDGKTMRLVANSLYEMQGGRVGRQYMRQVLMRQEQPLLSGSAIRSLGNAGEGYACDLQLFEHLHGFGELTGATVDEQDIGNRCFALLDAGIAATERLAQCSVVIARCQPVDIEPAVVALDR